MTEAVPPVLQPATEAELAELVRWAAAEELPLELVASGSKPGFGRPVQSAHRLDLGRLAGIRDYQPAELVLTAGAATPMAEIERRLPPSTRCSPSSRPDWAPLYGRPAGSGTLGGVLACNLAGPRRIKAGAARDHFLGFRAGQGRGEVFKAGGKVVKNVTGYDLCKLMAGSLRHAGGVDRGHRQGAAGAGEDPHAAAVRPRRRGGPGGDDRGARRALRDRRRRAICPPGSRSRLGIAPRPRPARSPRCASRGRRRRSRSSRRPCATLAGRGAHRRAAQPQLARSGAAMRDVRAASATGPTRSSGASRCRRRRRRGGRRAIDVAGAQPILDWGGGLIWLRAAARTAGRRRRGCAARSARRRPRHPGARARRGARRGAGLPAAAGSRSRPCRAGSSRRSTRAASSIPGGWSRQRLSRCRPISASRSSPIPTPRSPRRSCGLRRIAASAPRPARPIVLLGDELDSPRGRIYLIKEMLEKATPADAPRWSSISIAASPACPA